MKKWVVVFFLFAAPMIAYAGECENNLEISTINTEFLAGQKVSLEAQIKMLTRNLRNLQAELDGLLLAAKEKDGKAEEAKKK